MNAGEIRREQRVERARIAMECLSSRRFEAADLSDGIAGVRAYTSGLLRDGSRS